MCSIEERNNINIIDPDEENQINNQLEEQQKLMQANNLNRIVSFLKFKLKSSEFSSSFSSSSFSSSSQRKKGWLGSNKSRTKDKILFKSWSRGAYHGWDSPNCHSSSCWSYRIWSWWDCCWQYGSLNDEFFWRRQRCSLIVFHVKLIAATQAGSIVAICQSIGATGTIAASTSVAAGGAVGGAGLGWKWWKGSGEDKGGNEGQPPPKDPANEKKESVEEEINNVNEEEEEDKNVLFDVQNNTNHTRKL